MLILSWNVRFQTLAGQIDSVSAAIGSVHPDIVTLQEVKSDLGQQMADQLASLGLEHVYASNAAAPSGRFGRKIYHCVIASRWPVSKYPDDKWRGNAPFPKLLARATVGTPDGNLDVFTAHIPNGSANGWKKIDTFNVLSAALRRADDSPRVLTGDFNEPRQFRSSGQIDTWGETIYKD